MKLNPRRRWRVLGGLWALLLMLSSVRGGAQAPGTADPLARLVSLPALQAPLEMVLREVARRGGVALSYSPTRLPMTASVQLPAIQQRPLGEVLTAVLWRQNVEFAVLDGQVVLWKRGEASPLRRPSVPVASVGSQPKGALASGAKAGAGALVPRTGRTAAGSEKRPNGPHSPPVVAGRVNDGQKTRGVAPSSTATARAGQLKSRPPAKTTRPIVAARSSESGLTPPSVASGERTAPPAISPPNSSLAPPSAAADTVVRVPKADTLARVAHSDSLLPATPTAPARTAWRQRLVQVSLIPPISTNGAANAQTVNVISLNLLIGSAAGVRGAEVGGLVNISADSVRGAQVAGLVNRGHGPVTGVQVAGLLNRTDGPVKGVQVAGLTNNARGLIQGFQFAGVTNKAHAGIRGGQFAGLTNKAGVVHGAQFASLRNRAADTLDGIQSSGLLNVARGPAQGWQNAGLLNVATGVPGQDAAADGATAEPLLQLSGVANVAAHGIRGAQVAAVFNYARHVRGLQLAGLLNIADSVEGVSLAPFNLVRHGYHALEVNTDADWPVVVALKLGGSAAFYTTFVGAKQWGGAGVGRWGVGYGIGAEVMARRRFSVSLDGQAVQINEDDNSWATWGRALNLQTQFRPGVGWGLGRRHRVRLLVAPILNLLVTERVDPETGRTDSHLIAASDALFSTTTPGGVTVVRGWLGVSVGARWRF